ncbi:acyl-CoA dehydrogenase [Neisseria leonii]|uniref:acyl-CoA dehydrogenase n=1 Tax=Neisseria leonii TaxID=2995413 RepID=UPI00237B4DED|nr:acyl-CoA dehydrogenase [Neisseria sp. 3986]MDD9325144.1 acyl-CoA dehydrogenase [Neisseria sp. 3986]
MFGFLLFVLLVGAALYWRAPAWAVVLSAVVALLAGGASWFWLILPAAVFVLCCIPPVRRAVNERIFTVFKKVMPPMSETEQAAIDAGTVWWDGELFSGKPDFKKLQGYQMSRLSEEEQAFLDGPVEELCAMLDDWEITHKRKDLSPEAWQFIKDKGFLGMIIKKQYGGLEFSNYAHAKVVMKVGTRSGSAAVTVMVPNSLGPGELLQHYGTEEQKNYYLPRLAKGEEIPCFALTSPHAGSDAGSIPDYGVVARGSYTDPRTGERHEDVLGIRVSWEKRWITLAPVATVLGLAFKLYDPDGLLGGKKDIGITCALVPAEFEGVQIGRRHYPTGSVFMNGPTWGRDVFIPLDYIIGGVEYAGKGWQMLVECLSVGRCISLPANSVAAGKATSYTTSLYARIRDQFGLPIGFFEGVDEALARIGAYTYQMEASQDLALTALDSGEKPSVISAILKYHNTERMRKTINDAMDIHGGRTVVQGPRNYLVGAYQTVPVGITVEGANILTRSMMIFGQGAFRCHPFVLTEIRAAMNNDKAAFDKAFGAHVHAIASNVARSFWLGLTNGAFVTAVPGGPQAKYYRRMTRLAANFALLADMSMFSLGGSLKFKEKLSARLGDILSNLYIASAVLKRFESQGSPKEDEAVMQYAVEQALYDAQTAMDGLLKNLPSRPLAWVLRVLAMPAGHNLKPPADKLGTQVAREMMKNGEMLARLTKYMYVPQDPAEPVGVLAPAHAAVIAAEPVEKKLRSMARKGEFSALSQLTQLQEALDKGVISQDDFDSVTRARKLKREVIMVDDFDMQLEQHDEQLLQRHVF